MRFNLNPQFLVGTFLSHIFVMLLVIILTALTATAQGKGKPGGGGGGGGGGCPTYGIPTDDNSVVGSFSGNLDGSFGIDGIVTAFPIC